MTSSITCPVSDKSVTGSLHPAPDDPTDHGEGRLNNASIEYFPGPVTNNSKKPAIVLRFLKKLSILSTRSAPFTVQKRWPISAVPSVYKHINKAKRRVNAPTAIASETGSSMKVATPAASTGVGALSCTI